MEFSPQTKRFSLSENTRVGNMLIVFIVIFVLVGVGLFLYSLSHHNEYKQNNSFVLLEIINNTSQSQKIKLSNGEEYKILPGDSAFISTSFYSSIKSIGEYGETHEYNVKNPEKGILYISDSGFKDLKSISKNVKVFNNSTHDIFVTERTAYGGKRKVLAFVKSNSVELIPFIYKGSTIELSVAPNINYPSFDIPIESKIKEVIYNGKSFRVL